MAYASVAVKDIIEPASGKVLDNPYQYTDYQSASTREARETIFGDAEAGED